MTQVSQLASGINGAILTHIAIDTAPYPVVRYGVRELNARIVADLARLEAASSGLPDNASHSNPCLRCKNYVSIRAKIENLKAARTELQHQMDTTSANDAEKVFVVAKFAQSVFLLLKELENLWSGNERLIKSRHNSAAEA